MTPRRAKRCSSAPARPRHKLGDIGKSDAGPPLTGIGSHPRAELLAHVVDPNREVDPSFWQWNITTRNNQTLVGVIARENDASVTLRGPAGDVEIKKDDITNERTPRRSSHARGVRSPRRGAAARPPHFPRRESKTTPEPQAERG